MFKSILFSSVILYVSIGLSQAQEAITFEKVDKLPVGVFDMGYCSSDRAIFSIGGQIVQGGEIKNTEVIMLYSPFTDDWSKALYTSNNIAVKGTSKSTYLSTTNSIYTLAVSATDGNGQTTYPLEVLNLNNYRIVYQENNPHYASMAGIAGNSSHLYLFGGYGVNEEGEFMMNDELHSYDVSNDNWEKLASLPQGRRSNGVIVDSALYVIGGETEDGITNEVLKYEMATNQWASVGYLPFASNAHAITSHENYIYVVAGNEQSDKLLVLNTLTNDIDTFDIKFGFEKPGIAVLDDYLYLYGGYAPRSNTANRKTLKVALSELTQ